MGLGRGGAFFCYNTPAVPQGWVSQLFGRPFHKHPHAFRVQQSTARPATNGGFTARQLPATLASSQLKGSRVQARLPRAKRKHNVWFGMT